MSETFEIFFSAPPGLETILLDEAQSLGFRELAAVPGGVTCQGGWPDVWRANLTLRGAGRVLARIGSFPVFHIAQLDKRSRKFDWASVLRPDVPVRVDVVSRKSKVYHENAAKQRIENAIKDTLGVEISADAPITLMTRIEDNFLTFSVDTSGELLHKRGFKEKINKAPMRETLASLFLRACGYDGSEPVLDPMCGSGTFLIEAGQMAGGILPGGKRHFAFEQLGSFDPFAWAGLLGNTPRAPTQTFYGYDRDQGAIHMAINNTHSAGIGASCQFACQPISALTRPEGPPGLVIVNPPYGARIGNRKQLFGLYASLGQVMKSKMKGWRLAMITSDGGLAKASGLTFKDISKPIPHGGLQVKLYQTGPMK